MAQNACFFASKVQLLSKDVCFKVFLCENFQRQLVATSFLYITVHRRIANVPFYLKFALKSSDPGVAESAPQADTRSVCVIRITVAQHFNWYRGLRGSLGDSWASCFNFYTIRALAYTALDKLWAVFYAARSWASVKYWIHFTARSDGVHALGYNSAESEPIWMKSGALLHNIVRGWPYQILGASAVSTAGEPVNFLSMHDDFPSPNFTKFAHNTSIRVAMKTFGTEFCKFYCKGSFC